VVPRQVPLDPLLPEVVLRPKVKDLLDDLVGQLVRPSLADGRLGSQAFFAFQVILLFPSIECRATDSKVTTGLAYISVAGGMLKNAQSTTDFTLFGGHMATSQVRSSMIAWTVSGGLEFLHFLNWLQQALRLSNGYPCIYMLLLGLGYI